MIIGRWRYGGSPDAGRNQAIPEYRVEYKGGYWALVDEYTGAEISRHLQAHEAEREAARLARKGMVMR